MADAWRRPRSNAATAIWLRYCWGFKRSVLVPVGAGYSSPHSCRCNLAVGLTPLTARATGAWPHRGWRGMSQPSGRRLDRVSIALVSFAIYGALQLVAIARYPDTVNWLSPQSLAVCRVPVLLLVSAVSGLTFRQAVSGWPGHRRAHDECPLFARAASSPARSRRRVPKPRTPTRSDGIIQNTSNSFSSGSLCVQAEAVAVVAFAYQIA